MHEKLFVFSTDGVPYGLLINLIEATYHIHPFRVFVRTNANESTSASNTRESIYEAAARIRRHLLLNCNRTSFVSLFCPFGLCFLDFRK